MIRANDVETVKRVYRLRRLLVSHDAAVESTIQLCACFTVDREEILLIAQDEDRRRHELLQTSWRAAEELAK